MDSYQLETNIIESFRLAKSDIIKLQNNFLTLSETQKEIIQILKRLETSDKKLYDQISNVAKKATRLDTTNKQLRKKIDQVNKKRSKKTKVITRTIKKTAKRVPKNYVSTKTGKKFHIKQCPFAQNITPKNKLIFKSKIKALNQGLRPCKCVK
jgi:uncharacterized phage infection (PIP) family protein YhgE